MPFPAGKSDYPNETDLGTFLTNAGFVTTGLDLPTGIAAGIDQFQDRSGRVPFLATITGGYLSTGTVFPRTFDPCGTASLKQDLQADFIRANDGSGNIDNTVLATAATNAAASNPAFNGFGAAIIAAGASIRGIAVFINGALQIEGTNYWIEPYSMEQKSQPYRLIAWNTAMWPLQWNPVVYPKWKQSIVVVAEWGYWVTIPQSVWTAMLQLGAADLLGGLTANQLQSLMTMEQTGVSEKWDPGLTATQRIDLWMSQATKTVNNYRRMVLAGFNP